MSSAQGSDDESEDIVVPIGTPVKKILVMPDRGVMMAYSMNKTYFYMSDGTVVTSDAKAEDMIRAHGAVPHYGSKNGPQVFLDLYAAHITNVDLDKASVEFCNGLLVMIPAPLSASLAWYGTQGPTPGLACSCPSRTAKKTRQTILVLPGFAQEV